MSDLFMKMQSRRRVPQMTATGLNGALSPQLSSGSCSRRSNRATAPGCAENSDEYNPFENVLNLQLKKPKHWQWELSTSRSCSNIALPRILLYNHKGELLVDVNSQQEQVFRQQDAQSGMDRDAKRSGRKRSNRAATSNLAESMRKVLDREFNGLQIQEATPTLSPQISVQSQKRGYSPSGLSSSSVIDFYTNDLPDHHNCDSLSNSMKSVRFQLNGRNTPSTPSTPINLPVVDLPTPPSTTVTTTSSSSGPREKRRYRRSQSSLRSSNDPPQSILERFSLSKGRFSSPELVEEQQVRSAPRFYLASSRAGTLIVQQESFSRYRRRRRPKTSSSECLPQEADAKKSSSATSLKNPSDSSAKPFPGSLNSLRPPQQFAQMSSTGPGGVQHDMSLEPSDRWKHKMREVRRYRSDTNVLQTSTHNGQLSTSDEDDLKYREQQQHQRQRQRKYANFRRQSKRDVVTIDAGQDFLHSMSSPTAR